MHMRHIVSHQWPTLLYSSFPHYLINGSNIAVMQRYQSKLLRAMTNAPWYVSNHTLHFDLRIPYVYMVF